MNKGTKGEETRQRILELAAPTVILDFYHAAEHLAALARALYPGDDSAREKWLEDWCHRLKHEGGQAVLEWHELPRGLHLGQTD